MNAALVLAQQLAGHPQSKTCSRGLFGGEKRLKDSGLNLRRNSWPAIGDGDADAFASEVVPVAANANPDGESAAPAHSVNRIGNYVRDDLAQLSCITNH